jgi:sporulation protein YlmC with PRC-barrel domain
MKLRIDRSTTVLATAILLAYASVSDAQDNRSGAAREADRPAAAQSQRPAAQAQNVRDVRMSQLIGMSVRNGRGERLGDVNDLVVDPQSGRVAYAVIGAGGFLGLGEKLSAFPMSSLKVAYGNGAVGADATRANPTGAATTRDRAPGNPLDNDGVRGDKGPVGSDRAATAGADRAATAGTTRDRAPGNPLDNDGVRGDKGPIGTDRTAAAGTTRDASPGNPLDNDGVPGDKGPIGTDRVASGTERRDGKAGGIVTGAGRGDMYLVLDASPDRLKNAPNFDRDKWPDWNDANFRGTVDKAAGVSGAAGRNGAQGRLLRASQLMDANVHDAQRKDIGDIEDLVVDVRDGRVRYAVVEFDRGWLSADKLVAVPMSALRASGDRGELTFNGDRSRLERAPSFASNAWPDLNSARYRGDMDRYLSSWGTGSTPGAGTTAQQTDRSRGSTAATNGGGAATGSGTTR